MTAVDLSAIRAQLAGITPGKWEAVNRPELAPENDPDILAMERAGMGGEAGSSVWVGGDALYGSLWPNRNARADAAFIAAAPSMVAGLLAVVERVEALHVEDEQGKCSECTPAPFSIQSVSYPCPTIRAITGEGGA